LTIKFTRHTAASLRTSEFRPRTSAKPPRAGKFYAPSCSSHAHACACRTPAGI
jgi:hypothetical protein